MEPEKRINPDGRLEVRAEEDGGPILRGYAALFNVPGYLTADRSVVEYIRPGAFDESLKEDPDVVAKIQHQGGTMVIGRTKNETLRLWVDGAGLGFEVELPDTQAARDIHALVGRGDIDQSSFAFALRGDPDQAERVTWENGQMTREVLNADVKDVSPVTDPVYTQTTVEARSTEVSEDLRERFPEPTLEQETPPDVISEGDDPSHERERVLALKRRQGDHGKSSDYPSPGR